jgi:cobalt-zinc-cadmium efflux system outer membrane protein
MTKKTCWVAAVAVTLAVATPLAGVCAAESTQSSHKNTEQDDLANFVRQVVDTHPSVSAARAALDASSAYEAAASRPLYNPELEFEAEDTDVETRTVGISQTLDWGGKRRARLTVAEAERRSVDADFTAVRWQVSVGLLTALADYQTETERRQLAEARATAMQEFADLSRQRFDSGDISQIELDLAVLANTQARMQLATATTGVAESKQAVVNFVGQMPVNRWPSLDVELPPVTATGAGPEELVMALPQVRAAQLNTEVAAAKVMLRQRERRVDPTLSLRGGKEGDEDLVALNVTIPLPVRNSFRHEVTAADAEYRQAKEVLSDVSRRAYSRFLGAKERYEIAQAAWKDWQQTGDVSLQSQDETLRRLWQAGEIGTTDYLVQLKQTLDTGESALELRSALWRAWFEWMTASGHIKDWLGERT